MQIAKKSRDIPVITKSIKIAIKQPQQLKKKNAVIKLEVNKLLKSELNPFQHRKSQIPENHTKSLGIQSNSQSIDSSLAVHGQKQICKTFEQLYFQKIKELKLNQTNFLSNGINKPVSKLQNQENIRPNSCKNIVSIKKNVIPMHPESTKHSSNKQNFTSQKFQQKQNLAVPENKFFKKPKQKSFSQPVSQNQKNQINSDLVRPQSKEKQNKAKKVLRLKKGASKETGNVESIVKSNKIDSTEQKKLNQKKEKLKIQFLPQQSIRQNIYSSFTSNPSNQLKKIQISTPSSSSTKKYPVTVLSQQLQQIFKNTCETKLNHTNHEHIWGGTQCFLSYDEFLTILIDIGLTTEQKTLMPILYNNLWVNLGGNLYGGIVKSNFLTLLNMIFSQSSSNRNFEEKNKTLSEFGSQSLVDRSSLKLIKLTEKDRLALKDHYRFLKLKKLEIKQLNLPTNDDLQRNLKDFTPEAETRSSLKKEVNHKTRLSNVDEKDEKENLISLENNAYLMSISVKSGNQQMSPLMQPHTYSKQDSLVTDFSPKLSSQQYQPFRSTVLESEITQIQNREQVFSKFETDFCQSFPQRKPLLSVDINLGEGSIQKLIIYEDQNPYDISLELKEKYNIDEQLRIKFQKMLRTHMRSLLFKIEEVSQELFEDSVELIHEKYDQEDRVDEECIEGNHEQNDFAMMEKEDD